jgi:hypothetical protein
MIINTDFDNPLEEDIVFEETEQTQEYSELLKNSENILKATLYLKKIAGMSPVMNKLVKVSTIDATEETPIVPDPETNLILFKNVLDLNLTLFINGGELVLLPFESFDFPLEGIDTISFIGKASVVETQYRLA